MKVNKLPALMFLSEMGANTGAVFTSFTVMAMDWDELAAGEPLSVTRIVTG